MDRSARQHYPKVLHYKHHTKERTDIGVLTKLSLWVARTVVAELLVWKRHVEA